MGRSPLLLSGFFPLLVWGDVLGVRLFLFLGLGVSGRRWGSRIRGAQNTAFFPSTPLFFFSFSLFVFIPYFVSIVCIFRTTLCRDSIRGGDGRRVGGLA